MNTFYLRQNEMTALQTADSSATGSGTGWGAPAPQTSRFGGLPPPAPPHPANRGGFRGRQPPNRGVAGREAPRLRRGVRGAAAPPYGKGVDTETL